MDNKGRTFYVDVSEEDAEKFIKKLKETFKAKQDARAIAHVWKSLCRGTEFPTDAELNCLNNHWIEQININKLGK